jgi:hypothetical protein
MYAAHHALAPPLAAQIARKERSKDSLAYQAMITKAALSAAAMKHNMTQRKLGAALDPGASDSSRAPPSRGQSFLGPSGLAAAATDGIGLTEQERAEQLALRRGVSSQKLVSRSMKSPSAISMRTFPATGGSGGGSVGSVGGGGSGSPSQSSPSSTARKTVKIAEDPAEEEKHSVGSPLMPPAADGAASPLMSAMKPSAFLGEGDPGDAAGHHVGHAEEKGSGAGSVAASAAVSPLTVPSYATAPALVPLQPVFSAAALAAAATASPLMTTTAAALDQEQGAATQDTGTVSVPDTPLQRLRVEVDAVQAPPPELKRPTSSASIDMLSAAFFEEGVAALGGGAGGSGDDSRY